MKVLFLGLAYFCLAFFLHLTIWKVHIPKRQTKTLLQIFLGTLFVGLFTSWTVSSLVANYSLFLPKGLSQYLHISLFFISLTLAYITTYSAIEVDSPSLVMVMTIARAGSKGLDKKSFDQLITDDVLIKPRIRDLVVDKMVFMDKYKYRLTPKGVIFAKIFIIYRKLLKASKGG